MQGQHNQGLLPLPQALRYATAAPSSRALVLHTASPLCRAFRRRHAGVQRHPASSFRQLPQPRRCTDAGLCFQGLDFPKGIRNTERGVSPACQRDRHAKDDYWEMTAAMKRIHSSRFQIAVGRDELSIVVAEYRVAMPTFYAPLPARGDLAPFGDLAVAATSGRTERLGRTDFGRNRMWSSHRRVAHRASPDPKIFHAGCGLLGRSPGGHPMLQGPGSGPAARRPPGTR